MLLQNNLSLLLDLYELTMGDCYYTYKEDTFATFELSVRILPKNRKYLIFCGLEDIINYIKNLKFYPEDLNYLRKQKIFSSEFLEYLAKFKFTGDIWALPEGTVFFAGEPVIRVSAPIIQAQILESFFLNTINLQTMVASKASRIVCAAEGRTVYDFSLRRTHGQDAAVKVARASYLAGCSGTSNVLAGKIYKIPIVGTMAHSFVMSFKEELDAFLAYAEMFPDKTILLIDTYDVYRGIENAIKIGCYLKEKGFLLKGIRIDSGDLVLLSKYCRQKLDKAGLSFVKIFASGNLDEFKIKSLISAGAPIDSFGVGTNMGTSSDAPYLDVIYKITEVTDENAEFLPTMKLSKAKITYPGKKQIYRLKNKNGIFFKDILALEGEKIKNAEALLVKIVEKGRIIYDSPSLEEIKKRSWQELLRFDPKLRDIKKDYFYPVEISKGILNLREKLFRQIKKRQ